MERMHKEQARRKRFIGKNALLLTGAIALLAPPIINFDTTRRVVTAAIGRPVQCAESGDTSSFDTIAIFDGGPTYGTNERPFPNSITKKRSGNI